MKKIKMFLSIMLLFCVGLMFTNCSCPCDKKCPNSSSIQLSLCQFENSSMNSHAVIHNDINKVEINKQIPASNVDKNATNSEINVLNKGTSDKIVYMGFVNRVNQAKTFIISLFKHLNKNDKVATNTTNNNTTLFNFNNILSLNLENNDKTLGSDTKISSDNRRFLKTKFLII